MRTKLSAIIALLLIYPLPSYAANLKVVASFSILGDMVREVAGNHADIVTLVGPNGDAHMYEPSPADAKSIAVADLVIVNGLGFEGWIGKLIATSGHAHEPVIASKGVTPLQFEGTPAPDPHAWQDVANGKIYITNIRDALIKSDSSHADDYRKNAAKYLQKLDTLENWVKTEIAKIPAAKRSIITTHDAFQYFGHAYGVTLHAPIGMNTEAQASAADIAHLIDQIRSDHIRALFMENITDSRLIKQLETDGGAYMGGTLYSDALSPADGEAGTYLKMFTHNVQFMTAAMLHNQ